MMNREVVKLVDMAAPPFGRAKLTKQQREKEVEEGGWLDPFPVVQDAWMGTGFSLVGISCCIGVLLCPWCYWADGMSWPDGRVGGESSTGYLASVYPRDTGIL